MTLAGKQYYNFCTQNYESQYKKFIVMGQVKNHDVEPFKDMRMLVE